MRKAIIFILFSVLTSVAAEAQNIVDDSVRTDIGRVLTRIVERELCGRCPVTVNRIALQKGKVRINASVTMSYYPLRSNNLSALTDSVRALLPAPLQRREIEIVSDGRRLEELIPLGFNPSSKGIRRFNNSGRGGQLVRRQDRPFDITEGLAGRHIALWQSHGLYFDQSRNDWRWQRPIIWQTVEDLFTQSFVVPYLVPMLENAGATVMLPRERDFNTSEIIIDNDGGIDTLSTYTETVGANEWKSADKGFAHRKQIYLSGENPFADGSSRIARTVDAGGESSTASWSAEIPESGEYAVYVSYAALPGNVGDAPYTVRHAGGESRFLVNQKTGGGTWVYLGTFRFRKGMNTAAVTLSNRSSERGTVCADAVKIGGGYGNIARTVCDSMRIEGVEYRPETSGMPRYCEGARYWLQWAGFGEEVYSPKNGTDDYKDDYMSRGEWVNALMGGSERLPKEKGLGIPIDLSLAFHSDAGVTDDCRTIGTLGIFCTKDNRGRFEGGASRYRSRDLTDLVMSQISSDIRRGFDPQWRRRGMWNKAYFECRVPSAPSMLLELLSHQNLSDMRYGHDPNFKFTVARAIYKAILQHLAAQYGTGYIVAPLPVDTFSVRLDGENATLSWAPVRDSLEPTATAEAYIVYTRMGDGGFDNGTFTRDTTFTVKQKPGTIYGYRVTAVNAGGESFPSETLSACTVPDARGEIVVVNGFDRVAAPESNDFGFINDFDSGSAYIRDVAFTGKQRVFDPSLRRERNELLAFGASYCDRQGGIVGGNTFDYPYLYGTSIVKAGYSFTSSSAKAVETGSFGLDGSDAVVLVLGKQRASKTGCGAFAPRYRCFPAPLQQALTGYLGDGGSLFVSGAYVGTDLFIGEDALPEDAVFARNILHIDFLSNRATRASSATTDVKLSPDRLPSATYVFCTEYTPECYTVNSTDAIAPYGDGAYEMMRYPDSALPAAVGYRGGANATFVMGFPFESIRDAGARDALLADILDFLKPQNPNKP